MTQFIRQATEMDVPNMVALSEQKRHEYAQTQTTFWKKAKDSVEKQTAYFRELLQRDSVIALVHEEEGAVKGFLIAKLEIAPPVYNPGGLTCSINDFVVETPTLWQTIGADLLKEALKNAKEKEAIQVMVDCGHFDVPKQALLNTFGLSIASEWYVRQL